MKRGLSYSFFSISTDSASRGSSVIAELLVSQNVGYHSATCSAVLAVCKQDAVNNGILRLRYRHLSNICVVFDSGPFAPLCEIMTLCPKPERYKILYCRKRRTEPRPRVTCSENLMLFGHVVFEKCQRTDRQTDRPAGIHTR